MGASQSCPKCPTCVKCETCPKCEPTTINSISIQSEEDIKKFNDNSNKNVLQGVKFPMYTCLYGPNITNNIAYSNDIDEYRKNINTITKAWFTKKEGFHSEEYVSSEKLWILAAMIILISIIAIKS